jgi:Cu-Zn family superoxide dismutase
MKEGEPLRKDILIVFIVLLMTGIAAADERMIRINLVNDHGIREEIGTITARDSAFGLMFIPQLHSLPPGIHGFHVHQNPDCRCVMEKGKSVAGLAAGGHYDPAKTDRHEGPYGDGHLGDLPFLYVDRDGKASSPVLAPRLKAADLQGRALVIHAGGDNYSDLPEKLGGGGSRIACGVVK